MRWHGYLDSGTAGWHEAAGRDGNERVGAALTRLLHDEQALWRRDLCVDATCSEEKNLDASARARGHGHLDSGKASWKEVAGRDSDERVGAALTWLLLRWGEMVDWPWKSANIVLQ
jgi:hypothetical protein